MLGYTAPNNDVYIFFEGDEVGNLGREKIRGHFVNFNNPEVIGTLEASIVNENLISGRIKTPTIKDENSYVSRMIVLMRKLVHKVLRERGSFEEHEGFRHICLRDVNKIDNPMELFNYKQMLHYIERTP